MKKGALMNRTNGSNNKVAEIATLYGRFKFPVEPYYLPEKFNNLENKIKNTLCFSHLRWDFVYQRPQHLISRLAKECRVFFIEEPIFGNIASNHFRIKLSKENVIIIVPQIKEGLSSEDVNSLLVRFINQLISEFQVTDYVNWYLTPMAIPFTKHLDPDLVVYDCMDELSHFKGAHPDMLKNEAALMNIADVVFTGGYSLYEHKKNRHSNIYPMPSSIDKAHFSAKKDEPEDQRRISNPKIGFFGVIDERLDIGLLDGIAEKNPHMNFIMIGPVVKIDVASLPQKKNIFYLGKKSYNELPAYLAHWDAAILPFAKNDSTRFISPTKTPEYLCARKRVISTSIRDVVRPYGEKKLVYIADTVSEFSKALKHAIKGKNNIFWKKKVEAELNSNSWDITWMKMKKILLETLKTNTEEKRLGEHSVNAQVG